MAKQYTIGTNDILLRAKITNKETGLTSNIFFDSYAQQEETIRILTEAKPDVYEICLYGGYDMEVIGC